MWYFAQVVICYASAWFQKPFTDGAHTPVSISLRQHLQGSFSMINIHRLFLPTVRTACWAAFISICSLVSQTAYAGYLNSFSGNSSFGSTTNAVGLYAGFAVLDRLTGASSRGDAFGTGKTAFDTAALKGAGSAAFDTSARYLYLYQMISSPNSAAAFGGGDFGDGQPRFTSVTSYAQWNLFLSDDGGKFTVANAFGIDGIPFVNLAPANLGVVSPNVIAADSPIQKVAILSRTNTAFQMQFPSVLSPGQTTQLVGFTSNMPPEIIGSNQTPGPFVALGHVPAPVPEPSTVLLFSTGGLALFAATRRRRRAI